jgi:hypothetical protein
MVEHTSINITPCHLFGSERSLLFGTGNALTSVPLFMVGIAKEEVIDMFVDLS